MQITIQQSAGPIKVHSSVNDNVWPYTGGTEPTLRSEQWKKEALAVTSYHYAALLFKLHRDSLSGDRKTSRSS